MRISLTAQTHHGFAAVVAVIAVLSLAGCGSSGKAPAVDGSAHVEAPTSSNAAGNGGSKGTGTKVEATPQQESAARQAVIKMAACVEKQGIKVPPQNFHAADPIFSLNGINTKTKQFHTAYSVCLPEAVGVYKAALRKGE